MQVPSQAQDPIPELGQPQRLKKLGQPLKISSGF